jgi:hypothetical protein
MIKYILLPIVVLAILMPLTANASGFLHIKFPDNNATVQANQFLKVNGTSAPSNATRTNCSVALQVNQHGYKPVTPLGAGGAHDFTKWATTTQEMMKIGVNVIEGQIECFAPGNTTAPNYIHHLVHNVTGG